MSTLKLIIMKKVSLPFLTFIFVGFICNLGFSQNYSIQFDGDNDYVEVVNSSTFFNFGTGDFTLEHWFKTTGPLTGNFSGSILKLGSTNYYYDLTPRLIDFAHPVFHFANGNGQDYYAISTVDVDDGNWHHICGVRQSNTIYIYIDGTLTGQGTLPSNASADNSGPLKFRPWGFANPVVNYMDEVRIWDRALSASEVLLNSTTCSLTGTESGLVGYWKFNEGSGIITYDQTPYGNNGTLINGPIWSSGVTPCILITTISNPTNGGSTSGGGYYLTGTPSTVIATPNTGWNFLNWTENGNVVSIDSIYTFIVTENRTLVANFYTEVGIDEINPIFNIFPNPTSGIVHIQSSEPIERLLVYNSFGVLVKNTESKQNDVIIDLTPNPEGVHFVKITVGNKVFSCKVVRLF